MPAAPGPAARPGVVALKLAGREDRVNGEPGLVVGDVAGPLSVARVVVIVAVRAAVAPPVAVVVAVRVAVAPPVAVVVAARAVVEAAAIRWKRAGLLRRHRLRIRPASFGIRDK